MFIIVLHQYNNSYLLIQLGTLLQVIHKMDLIDDFRLVRGVVYLEKILGVLPSPGSHSYSLLMRSEGTHAH